MAPIKRFALISLAMLMVATVPTTSASAEPTGARLVELWFEADDVVQRQVLYEEGSAARGLSITLDGGQVYGGPWNRTAHHGDPATPWLIEVFVATPVSSGLTYHVVLVYDMASDAVTLYVNGVEVDALRAWGVGTATVAISESAPSRAEFASSTQARPKATCVTSSA